VAEIPDEPRRSRDERKADDDERVRGDVDLVHHEQVVDVWESGVGRQLECDERKQRRDPDADAALDEVGPYDEHQAGGDEDDDDRQQQLRRVGPRRTSDRKWPHSSYEFMNSNVRDGSIESSHHSNHMYMSTGSCGSADRVAARR